MWHGFEILHLKKVIQQGVYIIKKRICISKTIINSNISLRFLNNGCILTKIYSMLIKIQVKTYSLCK